MLSIAHDTIEPHANQPTEDVGEGSGEVMKFTWRVYNQLPTRWWRTRQEELVGSQNKEMMSYSIWSVDIVYVWIAIPPKMCSYYLRIEN